MNVLKRTPAPESSLFIEKKIPTFGVEHWAHSTVQKILFNRALLGEYQPMKGRPGR
jgi:hypothetical protein